MNKSALAVLVPAAALLCGFETYRPGDIKPTGSLRTFIERQVGGTTGHRTEVGYPFDGCMFAGSIENVYFEEDIPYSRKIAAPRDDIWWPYEQAAYFLDGMIRVSQLVDAPELRDEFEKNLDFMLKNQAEDGDLFRVYSASKSQWPMVVFFRAALAYVDETGDERVKQAFIRHYAGKKNCFKHPYDRDVLNVEGMLKVAEWTGDKSYVEAAEKWFENHFYCERFTHTDRVHSHGVTFSEMLKLPALLYRATGKVKWRDMALKAMRDVFEKNESPAGIVSACEYLSGRDPWEGTETCVTADLMCALGYFIEIFGDCEAADHMERIAYNALPGAMTKDFTTHQYISMPNQVVATPFSHGSHFFFGEPDWNRFRVCHFAQCCSGNINRTMPLFIQHMFLKNSGGAPTAMLLGTGNVKGMFGGKAYSVSAIGDYPFGDHLAYRFTGTAVPFAFRVPSWVRGAKVKKNGADANLLVKPGTIVSAGEMKDGDTLEIVFDQCVTVESDRWWHWLRRGAITFAYPIKTTLVREHPGKRFSDLSFEDPAPFNYAFDLEELEGAQLEAEFRPSEYPFETPNMVVKVPVREIQEWRTLTEGRFTPHVPMVTHPTGKREILEFVPYATTITRVTAFPDTIKRELLPVARSYVSPKMYDYDPSKPLELQTYDPEAWTDEEFMDRADVVQRSPDLWSDLEAHFHDNTRKVAYILFRFWSKEAGEVTCSLGASKCVQAFFESKEVYRNGPIVEGRMVAPFWFKVNAKKGWNYLKVKVATGGKEVVFGQDQYRREWGAKLEVFR